MPRNNLQLIADDIIDGSITGSVAGAILSELDSLCDYICTCESCSEYCAPDDARSVDDETWCQGCVENSAYYWESDGEYHSESEPEDETDEHGIPDYHDTEIEIEPARLTRADVMGIEIETYQTRIDDAAEYLAGVREEWTDAVKYERDGSLDDTYGVEIAAQPYSLAEIRSTGDSPWKSVIDWSRTHGGKSWDAGQGYGIHISLNGKMLNQCHRARIVRFFNDNKSLCESLAGRPESRWAKYITKDKLSAESKGTDKYQAAANRGDRIEVRIFRGTLNWDRFVRNAEFVDAVRIYTESCGCSDRALSADAFRAWMTRPENRTAYPLLATELGTSKKRQVTSVAAEV